MHNATLSSHSYDFRKDFSNICKRGLDRYLDISADLLGDEFDADREAAYAKEYVRGQWRTLKFEQKIADLSEGVEPSPPMGSPPGTPPYIHPPWNAERAADIAAEFEADVIDAERRGAAETNPVDIYRAVHLGTEMARKQNAGGDLPFTIDTGPEAVAYATDRLKSKIERNAVHNPIEEMYSGFLSYHFLKGMPGGEKVVYIDHYKRRRAKAPEAAPEQPIGEEAPEPKPDVKAQKRDELLLSSWLRLQLPPRDYLLGDIMSTTSRWIIYGETGVGKTTVRNGHGGHDRFGPWASRLGGKRRNAPRYVLKRRASRRNVQGAHGDRRARVRGGY